MSSCLSRFLDKWRSLPAVNGADASAQRQTTRGPRRRDVVHQCSTRMTCVPSPALSPAALLPVRTAPSSADQSAIVGNQKRKRQNRAAQRAFRERKEKHVRDLEVKAAVQDEQLLVFRGIVSQSVHLPLCGPRRIAVTSTR